VPDVRIGHRSPVGGEGRNGTVTVRIAREVALNTPAFPLEIPTGRHILWYEGRKNGCPLETVGVRTGVAFSATLMPSSVH
jgi:hypothetical protein